VRRVCDIFGGYEVPVPAGFQCAFTEPTTAMGFAVRAQVLLTQVHGWSDDATSLPGSHPVYAPGTLIDEDRPLCRGPRVHIGIAFGGVEIENFVLDGAPPGGGGGGGGGNNRRGFGGGGGPGGVGGIGALSSTAAARVWFNGPVVRLSERLALTPPPCCVSVPTHIATLARGEEMDGVLKRHTFEIEECGKYLIPTVARPIDLTLLYPVDLSLHSGAWPERSLALRNASSLRKRGTGDAGDDPDGDGDAMMLSRPPPMGHVGLVRVRIGETLALLAHDPAGMEASLVAVEALVTELANEFGGYLSEIGASSHWTLAFRTALGAVQFALTLSQRYLDVHWSPTVLTHPAAAVTRSREDGRLLYKGPPVYIAVHFGHAPGVEDPRVGRTVYTGLNAAIATAALAEAVNGDIIVTADVRGPLFGLVWFGSV
jgi:hypothetical protein